MVERSAKRAAIRWPLLGALLGLLIPGLGSAALAPPKDEESAAAATASVPAAGAGTAAAPAEGGLTAFERALTMLPSLRFGGSVGYDMRRDISDGSTSTQRGLQTTLSARGSGYLWQPWVARYTCSADTRMSQSKSADGGGSNTGKSVGTSGSAQLQLLPGTRYPFEAHYMRSENRSSSDLATAQSYAGQSYGFSQSYTEGAFSVNGGWDRSTQNQGRDRQDALQLSGSHSEDSQQFQLAAGLSRNLHSDEEATQLSQQANFSLVHAIAPTDALNFDNIVSVNQSDYHLLQASGSSRVSQVSSVAFWRPDEIDLTLVGGVRLLTAQSSSANAGSALLPFSAASSSSSSNSSSNANFNLGAGYDFSQFVRFTGALNLNLVNANGARTTSGSQSVGVGYAPETIELGKFRYYWGAGGNVSRSSGTDSARQASLQLNQGVSRGITLDSGSTVSTNVSQSVALTARSATTSAARNAADNLNNTSGVGAVNAAGVRKQLSHSASLSWSSSGDDTSMSTSAQLGVNDSRSVGQSGEFFQSINLQVNSSMPGSTTSTWSGNMTVQAARQSVSAAPGEPEQAPLLTTSSSGSLSYQQQRLFNVRRLRLVSGLRLNSQALLPLLGGPQDQEMAAWDSRIDYMIGRTQLRLTFLVARNVGPAQHVDRNGAAAGTRVAHNNKSIAFTITRAIGDF